MIKTCKKFLITLLAVLTGAFCLFFIAGCDKSKNKAPSAVSASSIKYDGYKCTWSAVSGATEYVVKFTTNKDGVEKTKEYSRPDASFSYNGTTYDSVEISITAKNAKGSSSVVNKLFTRIDPLDSSTIVWDENGMLSWEEVAEATGYILNINGKEVTCDYTAYDDFEKGKNIVKIMPTAPDTYSAWSSTVTMTFLETPTNIKYDGDYLSWTGVTDGLNYQVRIDGSNEIPVSGGKTRVEYDADGQNFSVTVQAIGVAGTSISSEVSETKDFFCLKVITEYDVVEGALKWTDPNEAVEVDGYEVKCNGSVTKVTKASFDNLQAGNIPNKVSVKPVVNKEKGDVYFSSWSQEWTIKLLEAPVLQWNHTLNLDGDALPALYWNDVSGDVSGYKVEVIDPNGQDIGGTQTLTSYGNAYSKVGDYKIRVVAVAEPNTHTYNSKPTEQYIIKRLGTPDSNKVRVVSTPHAISDGFTVSWEGVAGEESGYQFYQVTGNELDKLNGMKTVKGQVSYKVNNIISDSETEARTYTYAIQTCGYSNTFETQRRVTLPSLTKDATRFTITVLAMPTNVEMNEYNVTWTSVAGANSYNVHHLGADGKIDDTTYSLKGIASGSSIDFSVCSLGNGADVLPSNYTPTTHVKRLAKPTGVKVSTGENEGILSCTGDELALSYNVWYNDDKTPVNCQNGQENVNGKIIDYTVYVAMEAVANYYEDEETKAQYYVTSEPSTRKPFTKLRNVEFKKQVVVGETLVWNAPSNATGWEPNYQVFDKEGFLVNGIYQNGEFRLAGLPAGDHAFTIKAIGDGDEWLNSDRSRTITLYKLETPKVSTVAGSGEKTGYTWKGVVEATGYVVKIGSNSYTVDNKGVGQDHYFQPTFTEIKSYDVQVIAVGSDGIEINGVATVDSSPNAFKQPVVKLTAPRLDTITVAYNKDRVSADGKITVVLSQGVANAAGYRYTVGNATHQDVKGLSYEKDASVAGEYTVGVSAVGLVFGEASVEGGIGTYYLSSDMTTTEITLLAAPSKSSISIGRDKITWTGSTIGDNLRYTITLHYTDEAGAEKTVTITGHQGSYLACNDSKLNGVFTDFSKVTQVDISTESAAGNTVASIIVSADR